MPVANVIAFRPLASRPAEAAAQVDEISVAARWRRADQVVRGRTVDLMGRPRRKS